MPNTYTKDSLPEVIANFYPIKINVTTFADSPQGGQNDIDMIDVSTDSCVSESDNYYVQFKLNKSSVLHGYLLGKMDDETAPDSITYNLTMKSGAGHTLTVPFQVDTFDVLKMNISQSIKSMFDTFYGKSLNMTLSGYYYTKGNNMLKVQDDNSAIVTVDEIMVNNNTDDNGVIQLPENTVVSGITPQVIPKFITNQDFAFEQLYMKLESQNFHTVDLLPPDATVYNSHAYTTVGAAMYGDHVLSNQSVNVINNVRSKIASVTSVGYVDMENDGEDENGKPVYKEVNKNKTLIKFKTAGFAKGDGPAAADTTWISYESGDYVNAVLAGVLSVPQVSDQSNITLTDGILTCDTTDSSDPDYQNLPGKYNKITALTVDKADDDGTDTDLKVRTYTSTDSGVKKGDRNSFVISYSSRYFENSVGARDDRYVGRDTQLTVTLNKGWVALCADPLNPCFMAKGVYPDQVKEAQESLDAANGRLSSGFMEADWPNLGKDEAGQAAAYRGTNGLYDSLAREPEDAFSFGVAVNYDGVSYDNYAEFLEAGQSRAYMKFIVLVIAPGADRSALPGSLEPLQRNQQNSLVQKSTQVQTNIMGTNFTVSVPTMQQFGGHISATVTQMLATAASADAGTAVKTVILCDYAGFAGKLDGPGAVVSPLEQLKTHSLDTALETELFKIGNSQNDYFAALTVNMHIQNVIRMDSNNIQFTAFGNVEMYTHELISDSPMDEGNTYRASSSKKQDQLDHQTRCLLQRIHAGVIRASGSAAAGGTVQFAAVNNTYLIDQGVNTVAALPVMLGNGENFFLAAGVDAGEEDWDNTLADMEVGTVHIVATVNGEPTALNTYNRLNEYTSRAWVSSQEEKNNGAGTISDNCPDEVRIFSITRTATAAHTALGDATVPHGVVVANTLYTACPDITIPPRNLYKSKDSEEQQELVPDNTIVMSSGITSEAVPDFVGNRLGDISLGTLNSAGALITQESVHNKIQYSVEDDIQVTLTAMGVTCLTKLMSNKLRVTEVNVGRLMTYVQQSLNYIVNQMQAANEALVDQETDDAAKASRIDMIRSGLDPDAKKLIELGDKNEFDLNVRKIESSVHMALSAVMKTINAAYVVTALQNIQQMNNDMEDYNEYMAGIVQNTQDILEFDTNRAIDSNNIMTALEELIDKPTLPESVKEELDLLSYTEEGTVVTDAYVADCKDQVTGYHDTAQEKINAFKQAANQIETDGLYGQGARKVIIDRLAAARVTANAAVAARQEQYNTAEANLVQSQAAASAKIEELDHKINVQATAIKAYFENVIKPQHELNSAAYYEVAELWTQLMQHDGEDHSH